MDPDPGHRTLAEGFGARTARDNVRAHIPDALPEKHLEPVFVRDTASP
ncbi:hypothetical protein AB0M38_05215 [Streptomyces sp. NPDC051742]